MLIDILRKRIDDGVFISLMWKFLRAEYMEQWQYSRTYCGIPQGSGINPIPVNIYLYELDRCMEKYKAGFMKGNRASRKVNPEYARRSREMQKFIRQNGEVWSNLSEAEREERAGELRRLQEKQRKVPPRRSKDETYKNLQYIRYADDFIISIIGSKRSAEALKADSAVLLREKLNLTLSVEGTKITHVTSRTRFLDYDTSISKSQGITERQDGKVRGHSGAVKLYIPHEKWEEKLLECGTIRIKKDKVT